jgi:hypothetical protein
VQKWKGSYIDLTEIHLDVSVALPPFISRLAPHEGAQRIGAISHLHRFASERITDLQRHLEPKCKTSGRAPAKTPLEPFTCVKARAAKLTRMPVANPRFLAWRENAVPRAHGFIPSMVMRSSAGTGLPNR